MERNKMDLRWETQEATIDGTVHTLVTEHYTDTDDGNEYYEFVSLDGVAYDNITYDNMTNVVEVGDWKTIQTRV